MRDGRVKHKKFYKKINDLVLKLRKERNTARQRGDTATAQHKSNILNGLSMARQIYEGVYKNEINNSNGKPER